MIFCSELSKKAWFCSACGIIGHEHKECGTGAFVEKDMKFWECSYVDPPVLIRSLWESTRDASDRNVSRDKGRLQRQIRKD